MHVGIVRISLQLDAEASPRPVIFAAYQGKLPLVYFLNEIYKTFFFFFWDFVGLESSGTWSPRRRESNALAGYTTRPSSEDGPVVYPANTFDSRLRGD